MGTDPGKAQAEAGTTGALGFIDRDEVGRKLRILGRASSHTLPGHLLSFSSPPGAGVQGLPQ